MSLKLHLLASNASVNTHRDSARSTRPPAYTSNANAERTYTPNKARAPSTLNWSEGVRTWGATQSLPSAPSPADSDAVFNHAKSLLAEAVSFAKSSAEINRSAGPSYIYYRIHSKDGAIPSKCPVSSDDLYLGRIKAESVASPHTAVSIMRCISTAEDLVYSKPSQLFVSTSNGSPIGEGQVPLLTRGCPGSTPKDPLVFAHSKCTKQLRVTYPWNFDSSDPNWLSMTVGEVLYTTHALPRHQPYVYNNGDTTTLPAYTAVNDAGKVGFAYMDCVEPC